MKKKNKIGEMLIYICVSYTIISLIDAGMCMSHGRFQLSAVNSFYQLVFTTIAVVILYSHNLFERVSPLVMVIIQYVLAMGTVFLFVYIQSFFIELHPDGYKDVFRSFTTFYIIGAGIYYIYVFRDAKKQNDLLQEIKNKSKIR